MKRFLRFSPVLILVAFALLFFWKLAFTDMILARGDTYAYFYPYWDVRNAAFRAGELPLWTPDMFMGVPLLANPQLGTFYPPNWLTIPFRAPDAIRYSILLHIVWSAAGAFFLFRQTITKALAPALVAASVFALSGYLGAHVEQINQLQGLSWMPWLFAFFYMALTAQRRILWGGLLAIGLALQIFSGHTQTVFITGFGLGIFAIMYGFIWAHHATPLQRLRSMGVALLILALATIIAVLLAIPQIIPTLELTGMSNRGGGFTAHEATAFSLRPDYLGRALLPAYDGQLFSEYIGYIGVIALGLAILGMFPNSLPNSDQKYTRIIWIVLALIGLTFAFGRFNPLYWQLAHLPGFNLFRVPARWLALLVLAMAMLSGMGLHALQSAKIVWNQVSIAVIALLVVMLMARLLLVDPADMVGSAIPTRTTLFMWGAGLVGFVIIVGTRYIVPLRILKVFVVTLVILELFLAGRVLPYNDLAPRDVYEGQRFTISQLLASTADQTPPGRVLSISQLYFDPGDKARLLQRYQEMGMNEQAIQTAFTAVKRQEMLFPNLSLTWGIPSIDGYEGGILPTIYYSQFTSLLLPEDTPRTIDGRLGELLARPECRGACIPDLRWLWMTDTRYIITDKVYDVWHEGIAYDTTLSFPSGSPNQIYPSPNHDFEATAIDILWDGDNTPPLAHDRGIDGLSYVFDGHREIEVSVEEVNNLNRVRVSLPEDIELPIYLWSFGLQDETIYAVTLVDERTGDFVQLQTRGWEQVLSSDIKIYEYVVLNRSLRAEECLQYPLMECVLEPQSNRAVHVHGVLPDQILPDDWNGHEAAIQLLRNGWSTLNGDAEPLDLPDDLSLISESRVNFLQYSSTYIEMSSTTKTDTYLFLADAYYPGWRATVNGAATPIYRANVMFRAVRVPAGASTVVFEFVPTLWYRSMAFGLVAWMVVICAGFVLWWRSR